MYIYIYNTNLLDLVERLLDVLHPPETKRMNTATISLFYTAVMPDSG